jgi:hypothetical protein
MLGINTEERVTRSWRRLVRRAVRYENARDAWPCYGLAKRLLARYRHGHVQER